MPTWSSKQMRGNLNAPFMLAEKVASKVSHSPVSLASGDHEAMPKRYIPEQQGRAQDFNGYSPHIANIARIERSLTTMTSRAC